MVGAYVYTPAIWPPLVAAVLVTATAAYAWRRRSVPGAKPFFAASVLTLPILIGIAFEAAAVAPATKLAWYKLQFVMQIAGATAVAAFIVEYADRGRWLTRRNLVLLSIVPLLSMLLAAVDNSRLVWRSVEVTADGSVRLSYAPVGVLLTAYAVGLLLFNAVVLLRLFIRSPQHRGPVSVMLLGQAAARIIFLRDISHPSASLLIDPSVFIVLFPWLGYAIAMFGFRILDPLPAARRTIIEQMRAGVVVFDADWHVVSLNPAAQGILGASAGGARGKTWQQLQPQANLRLSLPDDLGQPGDTDIELPEIADGSGSNARHYRPALSALRDSRGFRIGYLLMLRDVTGEIRAREVERQQQLLLAITQERERLARELHDSLGQTLAAARLQSSSARLLLARGEFAQADQCLEQLASMTTDAEADVREYLLGARTGFAAGLPFFTLLRDYTERFGRQYGLQVELTIPPQLEAQGLEPVAEVQLLRIIQEGLSNVRKHACADCIQVIFSVSDGMAGVAIVDDGRGFDPASGPVGQSNGFGLRSMRERAEMVGGKMSVISKPGHGTRVEVHLPVGERWNESKAAR